MRSLTPEEHNENANILICGEMRNAGKLGFGFLGMLTTGEGARQADAEAERQGEDGQQQIIHGVALVIVIERAQHCKVSVSAYIRESEKRKTSPYEQRQIILWNYLSDLSSQEIPFPGRM